MFYSTLVAILAIFSFIIVWASWFITPEGHVDVVKRFSKASYVAEPGLNFKIPLIDTNTTVEVRTLKNAESMQASVAEQMPIDIIVSMNWTVDKSQVLELFKEYGSLEQFEARVIDPKFRSIVKDTVPLYTTEEIVGSKRNEATNKIRANLMDSSKDLPISISVVNIENIILPENYRKSIETKQTNKNLADAEVFKLQQQNLEAQRAVNIANAEAESIKLKAKAEAESITLKGQAEASAIEAKARALGANANLIEFTKATQWNGVLPTTSLSSQSPILFNVK